MKKEDIQKAIKEVREKSRPRKFPQSFDLIINLKNINFKKGFSLEEFIHLPAGKGRDPKICAFVDKDLEVSAKKACDHVVRKENFSKLPKKEIKKIARTYNIFLAQASVMPAVAKSFGKYLAVKGKMPSPKAGHIITPATKFEELIQKVKKTIKIFVKKHPVIHCIIGNEKMSDEDITKNIWVIYETIVKKLPNRDANIKSILLKLTMGPVVKVV